MSINDNQHGYMICDVGGTITEISVYSLGDLLISNSIRTAEENFNAGIIVDEIKSILSKIPPEIKSYITEHWIVLSGRENLIKDLSHLIVKETGVSVTINTVL